MASSSDIESSLEMREILQHEVQSLSKEEESLDKEITALILKEKELTQTIETQKSRLISGTRRLKALNCQRLQAEYATQDTNDEIDQIYKSFEAKAAAKASLEVEALLLEKEIEWKKEDIVQWKMRKETKILEEKQQLGPMSEERDRLKQEAEKVKAQVAEKEIANEEREQSATSRKAEIEQLNREIRTLENRNEAYRQRMRAALQDLNARIAIMRQKRDRAITGGDSTGEEMSEGRRLSDPRWI